jgi:hypothetical protein
MGLDCYWKKPAEKQSAPLHFDPPLCFEGNHDEEMRREGWAWFNGRVFEDAILQVTGVSLRGPDDNGTCSSLMDSATVLRMAELFTRFAADPWPLPYLLHTWGWERFGPEEYRDLGRLFRAYGEAGYELAGGW